MLQHQIFYFRCIFLLLKLIHTQFNFFAWKMCPFSGFCLFSVFTLFLRLSSLMDKVANRSFLISSKIGSIWKTISILCSCFQSVLITHKKWGLEDRFLQYGRLLLTFELFAIGQYFPHLHCFLSKNNFQIRRKPRQS